MKKRLSIILTVFAAAAVLLIIFLHFPITTTQTVDGLHYRLDNPNESTIVPVTIERETRILPLSKSGHTVTVRYNDSERSGSGTLRENPIMLRRVMNNRLQTWGELWRVKGFSQFIITVFVPTDSSSRSWNSGDGEVIVCGELSHEEVIEYFAP